MAETKSQYRTIYHEGNSYTECMDSIIALYNKAVKEGYEKDGEVQVHAVGLSDNAEYSVRVFMHQNLKQKVTQKVAG